MASPKWYATHHSPPRTHVLFIVFLRNLTDDNDDCASPKGRLQFVIQQFYNLFLN